MMQIKHIGAHIDMGRFVPAIGSMIVTTHNKFLLEAMAKKDLWASTDYIGFFEYDHEFPTHTIERAFYYREPVVTGLYHYREKPFFPLTYYWNEDMSSVRPAEPQEFMKYLDEPGLHEIGGAPMGCVWIRRDVFEKFLTSYPEEPFFASPTNRMTNLDSGAVEWHALTDDLWFSRHVIEMGFKIYVDTSVKVKHLVVSAIDERFYIAELQSRLMAAEQKRKEAGKPDLPSDGEASKLTVVRKQIEVPKLEVVN
ncbi:MAG: hypothetical protein ACHQC8_02450 [Solirubrobacterales bacterium]